MNLALSAAKIADEAQDDRDLIYRRRPVGEDRTSGEKGTASRHRIAERNTRDVDIILNRNDLPRAIEALQKVGFLHRHAASVAMFLDGPERESTRREPR